MISIEGFARKVLLPVGVLLLLAGALWLSASVADGRGNDERGWVRK